MAKEKSTSWSASNSASLSGCSRSVLRTASVSAGVRCSAPGSGWSSPSMRTSGWAGTLRCRSEPPMSTRARSAAWTSNMLIDLGAGLGLVKRDGGRLDERPAVPRDDLRADEESGDAAEGEEGAERDGRLARVGDALAGRDDRSGRAARHEGDEHRRRDGTPEEEAEHAGELD